MKTKLSAAAIVVFTALAVWLIWANMDRPQEGTGETQTPETVTGTLTGRVLSINNDMVRIHSGSSEATIRLAPEVEIIRHLNIVGVLKDEPGSREDIIPGATMASHYRVEKDRPADQPLTQVEAFKVEVWP